MSISKLIKELITYARFHLQNGRSKEPDDKRGKTHRNLLWRLNKMKAGEHDVLSGSVS